MTKVNRKACYAPTQKKIEFLKRFNLSLDDIVHSTIESFYNITRDLSEDDLEKCRVIRKQEKNKKCKTKERITKTMFINSLKEKLIYSENRFEILQLLEADIDKNLKDDYIELEKLVTNTLLMFGFNPNYYTIISNNTNNLQIVNKTFEGGEPFGSLLYYKYNPPSF